MSLPPAIITSERRAARGTVAIGARWVIIRRSSVLAAVARRLALSVPLLFLVSALVFVLVSLAPGNITFSILGNPGTSRVPKIEYTRLAHQLGVDRPLPVQYWRWLDAA